MQCIHELEAATETDVQLTMHRRLQVAHLESLTDTAERIIGRLQGQDEIEDVGEAIQVRSGEDFDEAVGRGIYYLLDTISIVHQDRTIQGRPRELASEQIAADLRAELA